MATFYIQLEDRLQKISGDLTHDNIVRALGYTPSDFSGNFNDLEDNPLTQDGNGEFNIVDESGNIIAVVDNKGVHSTDFIAGDHVLSEKISKSDLSGYATEEFVADKIAEASISDKEVDLSEYAKKSDIAHYATKEELYQIALDAIENNPLKDDQTDEFNIVDESGYVGLKLNSEGLYVKDVILSNGKLSEKASLKDVENLINNLGVSRATNEDIDSLFNKLN